MVMVIMALDHVRDFIHRAAMSASPTDLTKTTPILFLTRWVTHICAPTFMLTAGLGAYLWWHGRRSKTELSTFLLTRGIWLILLELTVMRAAYNFDVSLRDPIFLIVLWVLGACMVGLAALVWLPPRALAVVSVATILLHNLLDGVRAAQFGGFAWLWNILHQPGAIRVGGLTVLVAYPLIPWLAVMALGFVLGELFTADAGTRQRRLMAIGVACIVAFVALRALDGYGDPAPWSTQPRPALTVLSFLNTTKYPPSLAVLLMTLCPAMLMLAWFERLRFSDTNPLVVFGRVPLFYFVVHFFAAHLAAVLLALVRYGSTAWTFAFHPLPSMGGPAALFPVGFGYHLQVAYLVWAAIVVALYPACRWFAQVTATRRAWWVSYL